MKQIVCAFAIFAALASPARAVSCAEGMQVIDQMSKILDLSDLERSNIQALITKAKIEDEQGRQRNCKIILADAIRFFLIKTVID
ncbi:MAG: hypothetical protein ACLPPF_09515 [Rhodomicrobium sp.]